MRVEPSTSTLGRCTKSECAMLQRYDICADQLSAKMLFMAGSKIHSLNVYGKVVKDLAEVADDRAVTEKGLMKLPPLSSVTYNDIKLMSLWLSQSNHKSFDKYRTLIPFIYPLFAYRQILSFTSNFTESLTSLNLSLSLI